MTKKPLPIGKTMKPYRKQGPGNLKRLRCLVKDIGQAIRTASPFGLLGNRRNGVRIHAAFRIARARRCFLCLCVALTAPSLVLLAMCSVTSAPAGNAIRASSQFIHYFPQREFFPKEVKTVLLWDSSFPFQVPTEGVFDGCPETKCRVTNDRTELRHSDAVVFSSRGVWNKFLPGYSMPSWRHPHQVWVIAQMEAPPETLMDWTRFDSVFNWTLHYRQDADLVGVYGRVVPKNFTSISSASKHSRFHSFDSGDGSGEKPAEKTAMIAWMSSNCVDDARRQRVVKELSRHIEVDTYGACGNLNARSCDMTCRPVLSKYRFYLALENSRCREYVTEKFFNAYVRGQVPVTDSDIHRFGFAPRGSYIQISDFASYRHLALYLKQLAANETAYNSYLQWTKTHKAQYYSAPWCEMCQKLHDRTLPAQVYTDLYGWLANDSCLPWSVCNYIKRVLEGWGLYYGLAD